MAAAVAAANFLKRKLPELRYAITGDYAYALYGTKQNFDFVPKSCRSKDVSRSVHVPLETIAA